MKDVWSIWENIKQKNWKQQKSTTSLKQRGKRKKPAVPAFAIFRQALRRRTKKLASSEFARLLFLSSCSVQVIKMFWIKWLKDVEITFGFLSAFALPPTSSAAVIFTTNLIKCCRPGSPKGHKIFISSELWLLVAPQLLNFSNSSVLHLKRRLINSDFVK